MNSKNVYYILMLVAILWGFGISATKLVLDAGVGVNMFIFIRFLIGGVVVALFYKNLYTLSKSEILIGFTTGVFLYMFFSLQTYGLSMTSISNTALYTATAALITPFIAFVVSKRRIKISELVAGVLLILAIYVNNIGGLTGFNLGDVLVLLSAFVLALNISIMGKYVINHQVENITVVSLFVCSLLGFVFAIFDYNQSDFVLSFSVLFSLIYLGVLTTAFAFIVQNKALNYTSEAAVSFILGTEAIWGIVAAVIVYNEVITLNTVISMFLVLFGFYLVSKY